MIYWNTDSYLLATGLPLKAISTILHTSLNEQELLSNLTQLGEKYLTRYQTIKEYYSLSQQGLQKLPLIFVIAGIPGTGKSAIAKELSTALSISNVIGGDALRSSLRAFVPQKENEVFFASAYNSWKFFGDDTKENLLHGYQKQSAIMNQAVQRMIADRGLRDGESLLVEYLHFLPSQYNSEVLQHPSFIPIVLRITDLTIYKERIQARARYSHLRSSSDRLFAQIEKYLILQDYLCSEAKTHNIPIINIDDIEQGFEKILDYVMQR
ncbi:MAG: hypothetical protein ACTSQB_03930, partial [Candidatus Heimdallarchaeota archaeon]